jgi:sugar lactone lactonase YvrE
MVLSAGAAPGDRGPGRDAGSRPVSAGEPSRRGSRAPRVVILRAMSSPRLLASALPAPALLAAALLAPACGGGSGDDDHDHDAATAPDADPTAPDADPGAPDAAPGPDAAGACGTAVPPLADLGGTEGIAIAADGTIYYSQSGGRVGRWQPGEASGTDGWVSLAGATTVWGMAITDDGTLYVATPGAGGTIWEIDTTAASPAGTALYPAAGGANGLTLGPDGAIYYGAFSGAGAGHVYRVTPAGARSQVTAMTISQPNGVLFDADGTLLVASYATGVIHRLTLDASMEETDRADVLDISTGGEGGSPDGLARDALGRFYVTDNADGEVLRYSPGSPTPDLLLDNVGAAANMAFGKGALDCEDLYVTSSGALRRIAAGATGAP